MIARGQGGSERAQLKAQKPVTERGRSQGEMTWALTRNRQGVRHGLRVPRRWPSPVGEESGVEEARSRVTPRPRTCSPHNGPPCSTASPEHPSNDDARTSLCTAGPFPVLPAKKGEGGPENTWVKCPELVESHREGKRCGPGPPTLRTLAVAALDAGAGK